MKWGAGAAVVGGTVAPQGLTASAEGGHHRRAYGRMEWSVLVRAWKGLCAAVWVAM